MQKSLSTLTRSGPENVDYQKKTGENVVYVLGSTNKWQNKHKRTILVEFISFCEIRIAETKHSGVVYERDGKYHVRATQEFYHKFEKVTTNSP